MAGCKIRHVMIISFPLETIYNMFEKFGFPMIFLDFYILREIILAISDKAGCLSDLLTAWEIT